MARRPSVIDALPEAERKTVVDAILSGHHLGKIAASLGVSRSAISDYKARIIKPALLTAAKLQVLQSSTLDGPASAIEQTRLAKSIVSSKPAQEWLSRLTERMATGLTRAEEAVQVVRGGDGEMVPIADDLAILPSFYTAHLKGIELLGKMSGELQDKTAAPSVAIQIVIPERSAAKLDDSSAIEVGGIRIGLKR